MAKMSVLDMVQDIMSDMNDDEVNSISDTVESLQVAQIIKSVYFEMMASKNWPHLRRMDELESSTDSEKPTHMKAPELCKELVMMEYNCRTEQEPTRNRYKEIEFLHIDDFLRVTNVYNSANANVDTITDYTGIKFNILNDEHPRWYTSFDDDYLVFNAYNSNLEDTLQQSQSRALMYIEPSFSLTDNFVPDLPAEAFPALLAEAKSASFNRIKQMPDGKAEQQAARQRAWLSRKAWRVNGGIRLPTYGRRTRK